LLLRSPSGPSFVRVCVLRSGVIPHITSILLVQGRLRLGLYVQRVICTSSVTHFHSIEHMFLSKEWHLHWCWYTIYSKPSLPILVHLLFYMCIKHILALLHWIRTYYVIHLADGYLLYVSYLFHSPVGYRIGDLDQMVWLAKEFDGFIVRCIQDQNASHIVQKCIEHIPQQHGNTCISF
jgi:hypothetical protein